LLESTTFRVFDISQTDEPSLGRQQQTGRFLPRRETEDDAADHTRWIVVGPTPPDLRQAVNLERIVDQAVLEIVDSRAIGKPAAVGNRDALGGKNPRGLPRTMRYRAFLCHHRFAQMVFSWFKCPAPNGLHRLAGRECRGFRRNGSIKFCTLVAILKSKLQAGVVIVHGAATGIDQISP